MHWSRKKKCIIFTCSWNEVILKHDFQSNEIFYWKLNKLTSPFRPGFNAKQVLKNHVLTDTQLTKKFATQLAWRLGAITLRATFKRYEYFWESNILKTIVFKTEKISLDETELSCFSYNLNQINQFCDHGQKNFHLLGSKLISSKNESIYTVFFILKCNICWIFRI